MKITLLELKQLVRDIVKESKYGDEYITSNGKNIRHNKVTFSSDFSEIVKDEIIYLDKPIRLGFNDRYVEKNPVQGRADLVVSTNKMQKVIPSIPRMPSLMGKGADVIDNEEELRRR